MKNLMQYPNNLLHANGLPIINLPSTLLPVDCNSINLPVLTQNSARNLRDPMKLESSTSKTVYDLLQSQTLPPPPMVERQSKTNLYIKGLPENFNDDALEALVPDKMKIKSLKAALEDDFRCKGYGFIDFVTEDDAREALSYIQTKNPQFSAKYAKENEKDKTNLYVTNIPKDWTSKDSDKLKVYFEKFGPIQSAFIMMEKSTNKTVVLGVGFVRFVYENNALDALQQIQKGLDYLPGSDKPIEAKYADKHNPETRKRRNPSSQVDPLAPVRSINLINPSVALANNLYGPLCSQPLLLRNQGMFTSSASQVPLIAPAAETGPYIDLSALYNLPSAQTNYLYHLQNQLLTMQGCMDLSGSAINSFILTNGLSNPNFTNSSTATTNQGGLDLANYSQLTTYPTTLPLANQSASVVYSKNPSLYNSFSNNSILDN